eukprot:s764_g5.t1
MTILSPQPTAISSLTPGICRDEVSAMGCAGAKANAISTAVAQKVRAHRERSRQKFARGPKSDTGRQSIASLVHALAPVLEEQESRRGVIWSQSENCFQSGLSVDPDSFNEGDLEVLRERPWQQMWRIHLQEYEDGANQLQEDTELPAMETLLETMRDSNDEAVKASLPQLKRFKALQRLLSLQEDLASLARKVALSLASEAQWPQLAVVLQKSGAPEVQVSNLLSMALTGFHLQGVFFRMVVDEDDWKTICAEVRMARQSKGPLLLALEGMGVRLLAAPVLNECGTDEASIKRTSRILLNYCQQLRYGPQEETELWKAAQKLPNPRKLLSLEVPLARAIGALPQSLRPSIKASECLALVFGVPPGELTSLRCGKPEVLVSDSTVGLLEEVATCLRCLTWRLKRNAISGLFGCPCEVWYLPEAEGADPAAPAIWEWQSNRFAVLFTSAAPQLPLSKDSSSSLVERLHSVAQQLSAEPGLAQHGRALRSLLREQQLPARFAPAVAELKLLGVQHLLVKNQALVEEAASVELMSRAAKHAVRHILTHRQKLRAAASSPNGCNAAAEVFFGQLGPKRKEVVDERPLQRLWAVDADGDWMQLIAKEAQLLSTEDSIGTEAPIPPMPPQKREVKSEEAELEAQLMLSALQVNPDATSEEQMQLAALRQGLLQVVFWVRLASMAHELSLTAAEPREKDPSRASSVSTADSEAPRDGKPSGLSTLLRALGHRLMLASRHRPLALAAATASELRISLPRDFTARLRVHALQLNAPMRVPIGPSAASTSSSLSIQMHFRCTGPLSYEEAFSEVLQADLPGDPAKPLSASGKLAAQLLSNRDLSLGRGRVGLLQRSPELWAPSVSVAWKLAAATAVLRPGDAATAYGVKHKAWTAKTLLQVVHYQLLSFAADAGNQEEQTAFLAKQLQTLKAAAQILGELGTSCPAELFASFFTLRGMICEREGDVDACYLHYLQALARLDDAWGDPRKPGGRGHPFAAFLVWKLGLISYCRSDTKCIVKFGDYFRSLVLAFEDVPFSWGPGALGDVSAADVSEPRCAELLRRSEARLSEAARRWCWRHDVLNVLQEGLLPAPCAPVPDELSTQLANHHSITGDRQDVFRGTVFACGVNELGQLGTGRDLPWSGAPVRVVALKEVRIKEVACGEAHCIALDLEGHLHAWGFDEFCQVGGTHFVASPLSSPRGPRGRPGAFGGCNVVPKPRQLQVGTSFVRVACGAQFSLALDSYGQVWSWGHGEGGVLALGPSLTARAEPTKVVLEKGLPCSWASWVACGSYHAFAVCEGQLYSWGRTEGGQLGLASEVIEAHIEEHHLEDSCVCLPHPILGLPPIRSAAGGDVHSLALDETGEIYSWGWGEFGQLGLGFSSSSYQVGIGGASSRRPLPQHLPLENRKGRALQVACGGAFSAALLGQDLNDGGQLLMWGANDVGQCGLPAKKPIDIASPTEVPGLRNIPVRLVACGTCHAVAIDLNGQAFSWGAQQFGKLGRSDAGITATFDGCDEPGLLRSVARLRLARVACGLHHSLLVTEVSGRRRSSNDSTTEEGVTEVSSGSQYAKT